MLLCIIMIILDILVADIRNQFRSVANLGGRYFMLVFYLHAFARLFLDSGQIYLMFSSRLSDWG